MKTNHVLMLTYNVLHLTRKAIKSVFEQDVPVTLWVGDDGSSDGMMEYLRALWHGTMNSVGLFGARHAGVSRLWNQGLNHLFHVEHAEHVLVVNNDIKLRPDTMRTLVQDGGLFVTCVGTSSGALFPGGPSQGRRRPHPDFSCFLIRRECWEKVGEFDSGMRIYCSDGDYHLRMHRKGIDAYCLDLAFWHEASGTLKNLDEAEQFRVLEQANADRAAFKLKWGFEIGSREYYRQFEGGTDEDKPVESVDNVSAASVTHMGSDRLPAQDTNDQPGGGATTDDSRCGEHSERDRPQPTNSGRDTTFPTIGRT
jgi:hypothetical protein